MARPTICRLKGLIPSECDLCATSAGPEDQANSLIVIGDAGSVLVHSHDGGIDHLHHRVMIGGQCIGST